MCTSSLSLKSKPRQPGHTGNPGLRPGPSRSAAALILAAALGWTTTSSLASESVHFTTLSSLPAGEWFGTPRLAGNTAYVPDATAGLQIVDVSNPASPVSLGTFDSAGMAMDIQLIGSRGYLADGDQGFAILDLTNPSNPTLLGAYNPGVFCVSAKVVGNRAYLACGDAGLHIVDISDPANPVLLSQFLPDADDPFLWASKLQVVGNTVYLASGLLAIVDVTDPANPVALRLLREGYAADCEVVGNRLYIAAGGEGVLVFDVATPSAPVRLTRGPSQGYALAIHVDGTRAFTDSGVVDLTDPAAPKLLGSYSQPGSGEVDVTVVGDLVYTTSGGDKLQILRMRMGTAQSLTWPSPANRVIPVGQTEPVGVVSSSSLPVLAQVVSGPATIQDGQITVAGAGTIRVKLEQPGDATFLPVSETRIINERVAQFSEVGSFAFKTNIFGAKVAGHLAYVGNDAQGLKILDVSNPVKPVLVSTVPGDSGQAFEADVVDGYAYIADAIIGLRVVDVRNPAQPVVVGQVAAGGAIAVRAVGNRAYVTDFSGKKLFIIDVSNPATPVVLSETTLPGDGRATYIVGHRAYVASGWGGVAVFDVSNGAAPVKEGEFFSGNYVRGLAVNGTTAYVLDYYRGEMVVMDLTDLKSPVELGRLRLETSMPRRIEIHDNMAFVVTEGDLGGLLAVDIADPKHMEVVGKVYTGGYARDIQRVGSLIYVADQWSGVHAYQLDGVGLRNDVSASIAASMTYGMPVPLAGTSANGQPVKFSVTSGPGRIEGSQLIPTGLGRIEVMAAVDATTQSLPGARSLHVEVTLPEVDIRRAGHSLEAAWTAGLPLAQFQGSDALGGGSGWVPVGSIPTEVNGESRVTLNPAGDQGFFRLWHPFPGMPEPLALTGWNRDVVLENGPAPKAERISEFTGVWFESGLDGYHPGLPTDREIVNERDPQVYYHLQPYTTNNVLLLTDAAPSNSLALATPTACSRLFVLSAGTQPNGHIGSLVVHYVDGSQDEPRLWLTRNANGTDGDAGWTPRVFPGVGQSHEPARLVFTFQQEGFSMFQSEIDLSAGPNAGKAIARVEFVKSFNRDTAAGVYAISGVRTPAQP